MSDVCGKIIYDVCNKNIEGNYSKSLSLVIHGGTCNVGEISINGVHSSMIMNEYNDYMCIGKVISQLDDLEDFSIIRDGVQMLYSLFDPLLFLNLPPNLKRLRVGVIDNIPPVLLEGIEDLHVQSFQIYRTKYQLLPKTLKAFVINGYNTYMKGIILIINRDTYPNICSSKLYDTIHDLGFDNMNDIKYFSETLYNMLPKLEIIVLGWNLNFDDIQYLGG